MEEPEIQETMLTLMIYMAADNDLEPYALQNLGDIKTTTSERVKTLVLLDRAQGYDETDGNWTDTRLFEAGNNIITQLDCPELGLSCSTQTRSEEHTSELQSDVCSSDLVGRKEWQSMCAAEGVKDGLEDVTAKAKELKQDSGALKPVKVDFDVPELPVRVEPTDNPLLDEPKSMTIAPAPVFSRASTPDFTPNFSARAKANDAVDDALDEARNVAADVGKWLSEVDAKVKELESGGLDATMVYGPRNELRRLAEELRSLQGRITNYGGEVETTPLPVNKYDQGVYDSKMKRYEYSARSTARRVTAMHRSASSQYTAAMREADLA